MPIDSLVTQSHASRLSTGLAWTPLGPWRAGVQKPSRIHKGNVQQRSTSSVLERKSRVSGWLGESGGDASGESDSGPTSIGICSRFSLRYQSYFLILKKRLTSQARTPSLPLAPLLFLLSFILVILLLHYSGHTPNIHTTHSLLAAFNTFCPMYH